MKLWKCIRRYNDVQSLKGSKQGAILFRLMYDNLLLHVGWEIR